MTWQSAIDPFNSLFSRFDHPNSPTNSPMNGAVNSSANGSVNGSLCNWFSSVSTYAEMSPDLTIRKQVNQQMQGRTRRVLRAMEWGQLFCRTERAYPLLSFVYQRFGLYSGLEFGRVRPGDRLNDDLHFPLVCWFDWATTFCEDFFQRFGVDLSDRFDETAFETIDELIEFLIEQAVPQEVALSQGRRMR